MRAPRDGRAARDPAARPLDRRRAARRRHRARVLGFADAGAIAVGQRADLVTIDTTSPRTAGTGADENTAVFAATAADVTHVVVDGQRGRYTRDDHEDDRARARRPAIERVTS